MINEENNELNQEFQLNQTNYISIKSTNTNNYVTDSEFIEKSYETPYFKGDSTSFKGGLNWENNDTFPMYLYDGKSLLVPKGVKRQIQRLPKKVLKLIDKDVQIGIEKCLLMVSNLSFTVFREGNDSWKSLSSKLLHEQLRKGKDNTFIYKHVVDALKYSTNATAPIIETRKNDFGYETYESGVISKQYRLGEAFQNSNLVNYDLKTDECLKQRVRFHCKKLSVALENPIANNLLKVYPYVTLPNNEEIESKAKELIKNGYKSKKGKLLTRLNQKSKSHYSDCENRSFVEENIKQYGYLTSRGYLIPIIGDYKSGGRVVDSFNLMPSWIRSMVKISDEDIVELDFKALHPNIALSIYGGENKYLTHEKVAKDLDIELSNVKIEHLSFFNKRVSDMKRSVLFDYYSTNEDKMLNNILLDKKCLGYKITSRRLFEKEVNIMKTCIEQLNSLNIYVLYVYDALYCKESDKEFVREVMNRTIINFNVYSKVK